MDNVSLRDVSVVLIYFFGGWALRHLDVGVNNKFLQSRANLQSKLNPLSCIFIMRRHTPTPEAGSVLSRASIGILPRKPHLERTRSTNHRSLATEEAAEIRLERGDPLVRFRVKRKEYPNRSEIVEGGRPLVNWELHKAREEIAEMKEEIRRQRSFTSPSEDRLDRFVQLLRDTAGQKQPPIYFPLPLPMPLPYLMQNQHSLPAIQSHHPSKTPLLTHSRHNSRGTLLRDPVQNKQLRVLRIKKNMGRWRRAANAVLFWIYLKRFCGSVQRSRLILFEKFFKNYDSSSREVGNCVREKMSPLFRLLLIKGEVAFGVEEGEEVQVRKEKVALMRAILKMVIDGLSNAYSANEPVLAKWVYFHCRHGSYACTRPLLTFEELELACISPSFRYLSAEGNLMRAAAINLLFFKTLLFNVLLPPASLPPQLRTPTIRNNLLLTGSLLYEVAIEVQDEYLLKVPKTYPIGNFEECDFVKTGQAMVVEGGEYRPGEVISGLLGREELQRTFGFSEWGPEKKSIRILLQAVSDSLRNIHRKLIERHY